MTEPKPFLEAADIAFYGAVSEKTLIEDRGMRINPDILVYGGCPDGTVWSCLRVNLGPNKGKLRIDRDGMRYWREVAYCVHDEWGHLTFGCWTQGRGRTINVGRFIATLFHGPCPEGMECCHNDGVAGNNAASNLRWDYHVNNLADTLKHGTRTMGNKHPCSKLSDKKVFAMRPEACENGWMLAEVADIYEVHYVTARDALEGKSWKHIGGPLLLPDAHRPYQGHPAGYRWNCDKIRA